MKNIYRIIIFFCFIIVSFQTNAHVLHYKDLNRIELISTMYALRYQIQIDKTPDERITFAVESGIQNYEQINFTGETN